MNAWKADEDVGLVFKSEEAAPESPKNGFEKGEYQWADEPEQTFFRETPAPHGVAAGESGPGKRLLEESPGKTKEETPFAEAAPEIPMRQMRKILQRKHAKELERTRENLQSAVPKPKAKKAGEVVSFEMSEKFLRRQIARNRDVSLYDKKWLRDREFKFFFPLVYYQNILATDLRWREDYRHLLFVRLMSYHNIGA